MAQDLFFVALDGGSDLPLDRSVVQAILARDSVDPAVDLAAYPDGSRGCVGFDPDETGPLDGLSFSHFGGRTMIERIFELADRFDAVLIWSGGDGPGACVTRAELLERASAEFEPLGLAVARDASHLNASSRARPSPKPGGDARLAAMAARFPVAAREPAAWPTRGCRMGVAARRHR